MWLFNIAISSLLLIGAWGAGYSAGMISDSIGFGNSFLWSLGLIGSVLILGLDVLWYIKKSSSKEQIRSQASLFTVVAGISAILLIIMSGSRSFDFAFAGWECDFRLRSTSNFMVFSVAFMLVSVILAVIAWVKYKMAPTP